MKKYDVIVVGGGLSGVASAISASREGAKVLIVEKGNAFGGAAVNCLVNPFMPNLTKINGEYVELTGGIYQTIYQTLKDRKVAYNRRFLEEELKILLNELILENNVDVLFHAYLFKANKKDGKVTSISLATKSGELKVKADYYIDATGDGQLAYLLGCPFVLGRESDNLCQPMTLTFRLGNVDIDAYNKSKKDLDVAYEKAYKNGEFINPRENILTNSIDVAKGVLNFNSTRVVKLDPTSPFDVTKAEIIARKQVDELYKFVKKHAKGLDNSFLLATASEIGVRESRKIIGEYLLTEKDCRAFTKFSDSICACNYDIDIHSPDGAGTSHYYFPEGEYYTIPYRCLIPKTVNNLLIAGRCISADHGAQASFRIMPVVCSIGEGAGTAIGMAVKNKCAPKDISVKQLQEKLTQYGAFLGI